MIPHELLILIAALILAVVIYRIVLRRRLSSQLDQHLRARQLKIQSLLDELGELLKIDTTTLDEGNLAASRALHKLSELNPDGSLDELIVDTVTFVEEWRASQLPA